MNGGRVAVGMGGGTKVGSELALTILGRTERSLCVSFGIKGVP